MIQSKNKIVEGRMELVNVGDKFQLENFRPTCAIDIPFFLNEICNAFL